MKLLWVKAGGLLPPDIGGKIRSYNILKQLARKHEITLFTFYAEHPDDVHPRGADIFSKVVAVPWPGTRDTTNNPTTARIPSRMLLAGPATETRMSSRTGWRRLCGSTGVGLAQPMKPIPESIPSSGTSTVPMGSTCLIGFSEIRPSMRAVGSPHRFAVQACADSCTQIANTNAMI